MEQRRRVPRVRTGNWPGRCRVEGYPEWADVESELVDLSLLGAGIEVDGGENAELVGQRVVVEVQAPVGRSVSLRLVGVVRNVTSTESSRTRVGIEFVDLSETEQDILKVFSMMKVLW